MKYIIFFIITILFIVTLTKESPKERELSSSSTILAFGDSITYGFGVQETLSYPSLLSTKTELNILNAGVNGDTSAEGLERLPSLLLDDSIELMLLCFGGNDIIQKVPTSELKSNLKKIIQLAKEKNIQVILISVPNVSIFGLQPLNLYEELADEEDIELIEGLLAHVLSRSSLKSDYIHPNVAGYRYMADEIHLHLQSNGWVK